MNDGESKAAAKRSKRAAIAIAVVIAAIVVVALAIQPIMLGIGKANLLRPESSRFGNLKVYSGAESSNGGRTVTYEGKTYQLNEAVVPICVIGRDKEVQVPEKGFNGQADAIMVLAVNTENNDINVISIPRDSMVDSLDAFRKVFGNTSFDADKMQICLTYSYGANDEQSSEYTLSAVSSLLFGVPVERYCAFDASGLGELADLAGGVTLEALYDVPSTDYLPGEPIAAGQTVTLRGDDALRYVRYRDEDRFASALERLERQRQFVAALGKKLAGELRGNPFKIIDVYRLFKSGNQNLCVALTSSSTVAYAAPYYLTDKTLVVPATVKLGKTYKVTSISANAFNGSKVTKLTIGKYVKAIGKNACKGAKKLKTVTLKTSKLTSSAFKNLVKNSKIKTVKLSGVSKSAKKNYKKWAKAYKVTVK